ncbi:MAG: hypothetical protein EHM58_00520 [Ignavibacteriae bacterium]|nr:MAG: hypothetical protein EHM58_00520 [Ignavibacteriota bacterium]
MPELIELIKKLKDVTLENLPGIIDAEYEGDPHGTNADKLYFIQNVHNYMKNLGIAMLPQNTKFVCKEFSDLLDPFFDDIVSAYSIISNESNDTNKFLIHIYNTGNTYQGTYNFNTSGYIIFEGANKYGTILDGVVNMNNLGTHIFRNIIFKGNINITHGTVLFENCAQISGTTNISNTATVYISKADYWGPVLIPSAEVITNICLWCEDILNMGKDPVTSHSIVIPETLVTPQIVLRRVAAQGDYDDTGNLISEVSGFEANILEKQVI